METTLTTTQQPAEMQVYSQPTQAPVYPARERETVNLSDEQVRILTAPFPAESFDVTPDGKIYVPFHQIEQRFNDAFGLLKWRMSDTIKPNNPASNRSEYVKDGKTCYKSEVILWQDLIVDGVVVIEGIMDSGMFFESNKDGTYANALASARSKCLFEAAKAIGIGSQIKDSRFIEMWKGTYGERVSEGNFTKWRKKQGEGITKGQITRLFEILSADKMELFMQLGTLTGRQFSGPELETLIGSLSERRKWRGMSFAEFSEKMPQEEALMSARWEKAGVSPGEYSYAAHVEGITVIKFEEAMLSAWEVIRIKKRMNETAAAVSEMFPDKAGSVRDVEQDQSGIVVGIDSVPSVSVGLKTTNKGKLWREMSHDMLAKWHADKSGSGDTKMVAVYEEVMRVKLCIKTDTAYSAWDGCPFSELVRAYEEVGKSADLFQGGEA